MAFFDKLNDFAKNIGDKTTDAIETGKLNSKVNAEKNLAGEELKKIGAYYYEKFAAGEAVDPAVQEFCLAAKAHYDAADAAQAEIENIRLENEAQKAAAAEAAAAEKAAAEAAAAAYAAAPAAPAYEAAPAAPAYAAAPVQAAGLVCQSCGAANPDGTRFCGECGTKLEMPAPAGPKVCPGCGSEIAPGLKFCGECGTRVDT